MTLNVEDPQAVEQPRGARSADVSLFIDGTWRAGRAGVLDVVNPVTETPVATVALADAADLDEAIAAALRGFEAWRRVPALERGAVLIRAADLLRERVDDVARVLTVEQGKTLAESRMELVRAAETLAWNGEEAGRIEGRLIAGRVPGTARFVVAHPAGVVAAITAWNFPAALVARKLGAALAAGCSVILKAAEEAPGAAAAVVRCLEEAGVPRGAVNLVFGDPPEVSRHLLEAPAVSKLSFTGSTRVGRELARLAGPGLKRCTLELGGHAPVIVCADADIEAAVAASAKVKFACAGQSCIAPSRFYVDASRYEEFVEHFVAAARAIRVGDGLDPDVDMGPMADARRLDAMGRLTEDALARGATLLCGGSRIGDTGWFFEPTVLGEVGDDALVMTEEPFGPIAPIASVDGFDDAMRRANALPYGLAAYVFTQSLHFATRATSEFEAGNIGINQMAPSLPDAPLAGMKDSGYGYEGGSEGVEAFLTFKLVNQTVLPD
jgi:succinate-semialdehyde dehydrogenase/glutarate-semialdehyde dehydrogenase